MADPRGVGLTEEELGRIAAEHVGTEVYLRDKLLYVSWCVACSRPFPCLVARLYALVLRQSALLAVWGLPCSCDPDFDLPEAP